MARLRRYTPGGIPQHIIQRGNNRQVCFTSDIDLAAYAHWLSKGAEKYDVAIHGWVFMNNHVHLLATPKNDDAISRMMQFLGRHYVRYFNREYGRTGTLFEGRFKSCPVETEKYFLVCLRYIELNPVRAGMVSDPADYRWSSYCANAFGKAMSLWSPHFEYLRLGRIAIERQSCYRQLFETEIDGELITDIRQSTQRGLALGSEHFKDRVESLGSRRQRLLKPGPKN
ncbi:transposase [Oceanicoccus sp. KOV_DT_Chl]|uniref:transposase n=1 Tax=Oceanicoccus sp. KOV_DT_Chl TaxID=1904639 RepID=UPI000C7AC974|nr:transposase [Oceanicoccus sp. KOV_DT_Chl]